MVSFTLRKEPKKTGVGGEHTRKVPRLVRQVSHAWYNDEDERYATSTHKSQWDMIEEYCFLNLNHSDPWGRKELGGCDLPYYSLSTIGISEHDAMTDEDEFVLLFGDTVEKRRLIESIALTSEYRVDEDGIYRKLGEEWEEILTDSEENAYFEELGHILIGDEK